MTEAGEELAPIVMACGEWGQRWARRKIRNADVDVALLVWDMRRRIDLERLPDEEVLIEFEFRGAPRGKGRFWLHLSRADVELCLTKPGRDADLHLVTTPRAMAEVWLGDRSYALAGA